MGVINFFPIVTFTFILPCVLVEQKFVKRADSDEFFVCDGQALHAHNRPTWANTVVWVHRPLKRLPFNNARSLELNYTQESILFIQMR